MRMYEEREEFTREMIHAKAVQIFEDYIIEDCKWLMRPQGSHLGQMSDKISGSS